MVALSEMDTMTDAVSTTPEGALRGGAYLLLAHLLAGPPDDDLLARLRAIDVARRTREGDALTTAWEKLKEAAQRGSPAQITEEYHGLFIGIGRGELVPYASSYLTGFLMETPLALLRSDLKRLGFARREGVSEPEDHVAALCEVMAMLSDGREAGGFEAQKQFFEQHLAPWVARFFEDLHNAESARFYRSVGRFGAAFFITETRYFSMQV